MLGVANDDSAGADGRSMLDEIRREGARTMLATALEAEVEVDAYLASARDEDGHALVTRNGPARPREVQAVAGDGQPCTPAACELLARRRSP